MRIVFNILTAIVLTIIIIINTSVLAVSGSRNDARKTSNSAAKQLLSVAVVFRHGDRNPSSTYANDPYRDESNFPEGFGQLVNRGKTRHYILGKWLRKRYSNFLSYEYRPNEIYVRSTDMDRTLQSAAANLAGLYPPRDDQIWNAEIPWQPIPIHTVAEADDALLRMTESCAKHDQLMPDYNRDIIDKANVELYQFLSNQTGQQIATVADAFSIGDTLRSEQLLGLTLPDWAHAVYPEPLTYLESLALGEGCMTTDSCRLKTGPFFYELIDQFNRSTQLINQTKFHMYSAHDQTIIHLLLSMGDYRYNEMPAYASILIFELFVDNSITVSYRNETDMRTVQLGEECGQHCDFNEFVRILKPISVRPDDWKIECQSAD